MKFSFKYLDQNISTKEKTIVLVMGMFFALSILFIFMQYANTKEFILNKQHLYEQNVVQVFNKNLKLIKFFYQNRATANLNSYGIISALIKKDKEKLKSLSKQRWEVLKKENPFLLSMSFYDNEKKLITFLGKEPIKNIKSEEDGYFFQNNSIYKVVLKTTYGGYLVFDIDIRYLLFQIKELLQIDSFLRNKDSNELIYLNNCNVKDDFLKNQNVKQFISNNKIFLVHELDFKENFKIIFFQDITNDKKNLQDRVFESIIITLILGSFSFIVLNYGFKILIDKLEDTNKNLMQSEEKLKILNQNLENRVHEEVMQKLSKEREIHDKQRILEHQNRLASMGEMIGSIAHQWRQPLTALSSILVLIELLADDKKLNHDKLKEKINDANFQINFMSKTIDDFRNFFKPNKQKELFNVKKQVLLALNLIKSSILNNNIKVDINAKDDIFINGYANEFAQVILNLLANSKDAILERKIENANIKIKITQNNKFAYICIKDNGGGISLKPIEKIFEPYVSTKHKSSGIGIGLYMSKSIIETNMQGKLSVKNLKNGAFFLITLSKSL